MKFAKVYPLYVQKAERKNRTKEEVDQIILVGGLHPGGITPANRTAKHFETFFAQAPRIHSNSALIKGVVCGVRVRSNRRFADAKNSLLGQADR